MKLVIAMSALVAFSAAAQESIYDRWTRSTYEVTPYTPSDTYRRDTYSQPPAWMPPEPQRYNVYSPSGQQIGTGQVDSSGRIISDQTGRPVGRYRY